MNQISSPGAYLPLGENILRGLGVGTGVVTETKLEGFAVRARGSLRDYNHSVMMAGLAQGGWVKATQVISWRELQDDSVWWQGWVWEDWSCALPVSFHSTAAIEGKPSSESTNMLSIFNLDKIVDEI